MVKNWKTTLYAAILNALYAALTIYQTGAVNIRDVVLIAAIQGVATLAKDYNIIGTQ